MSPDTKEVIRVTEEQLRYERELLISKYNLRKHLTTYDRLCYNRLVEDIEPEVSYVFHRVPGETKEAWEA